ncbi:MAG: hypothetical protein U0840_03135 [Gemmataceae bacterium]
MSRFWKFVGLCSGLLLPAASLAQMPPPTPQPPTPPGSTWPRGPSVYTPNVGGDRQLSTNTAVLGNSRGPSSSYSTNPTNSSSLSTIPRVAIDPIRVQTGGSGGGGGGGGWGGGMGMGMGWGYMPNSMGYGMGMMGIADYTRASGQYWNDIESARMSREVVRQMQVDTQRKQMEWEMEYEKLRPTAIKMRDSERAADLDWARNDPPKTEIWSGRSLNVLLRSIFNSPSPAGGPRIYLEPTTVRGLNLTDRTTRGNLSLAKDDGKIDWTDALQEEPFDSLRDEFSKNFARAMRGANEGTAPDRTQLRELRNGLSKISDKLEDMVRDLPPSRYIESRRLINRLQDQISGLSNPRVVRSSNEWRRNVQTVADLVEYALKNGLEFGPAVAPGDEAAYTAAYFAIRAYERGVNSVASSGN